jgi:hypothetical protein
MAGAASDFNLIRVRKVNENAFGYQLKAQKSKCSLCGVSTQSSLAHLCVASNMMAPGGFSATSM